MTIKKINPNKDSFAEFEEAAHGKKDEIYVLRLFISGMTPRSVNAIENLKKICDTKLEGRYRLEIIDIAQQQELVRKEDIIATPTLIKDLPKPIRRIVGDLGNIEKVLVALNLMPLKD